MVATFIDTRKSRTFLIVLDFPAAEYTARTYQPEPLLSKYLSDRTTLEADGEEWRKVDILG